MFILLPSEFPYGHDFENFIRLIPYVHCVGSFSEVLSFSLSWDIFPSPHFPWLWVCFYVSGGSPTSGFEEGALGRRFPRGPRRAIPARHQSQGIFRVGCMCPPVVWHQCCCRLTSGWRWRPRLLQAHWWAGWASEWLVGAQPQQLQMQLWWAWSPRVGDALEACQLGWARGAGQVCKRTPGRGACCYPGRWRTFEMAPAMLGQLGGGGIFYTMPASTLFSRGSFCSCGTHPEVYACTSHMARAPFEVHTLQWGSYGVCAQAL